MYAVCLFYFFRYVFTFHLHMSPYVHTHIYIYIYLLPYAHVRVCVWLCAGAPCMERDLNHSSLFALVFQDSLPAKKSKRDTCDSGIVWNIVEYVHFFGKTHLQENWTRQPPLEWSLEIEKMSRISHRPNMLVSFKFSWKMLLWEYTFGR